MNGNPVYQYPGIVEELPPLLQWLFVWLDRQPILAMLLVLMLIDVLSGVCLSLAKKTLSSSVSWRGMSKKAIMLLMVGVGAVLEPFAQGIPLSKIVAIFYTFTEAVSITENAAEAGVPLPAALVDTLIKLKESQRFARWSPGSGGNSLTLKVESTVRPETMVVVTPERPPGVTRAVPVNPETGERT